MPFGSGWSSSVTPAACQAEASAKAGLAGEVTGEMLTLESPGGLFALGGTLPNRSALDHAGVNVCGLGKPAGCPGNVAGAARAAARNSFSSSWTAWSGRPQNRACPKSRWSRHRHLEWLCLARFSNDRRWGPSRPCNSAAACSRPRRSCLEALPWTSKRQGPPSCSRPLHSGIRVNLAP